MTRHENIGDLKHNFNTVEVEAWVESQLSKDHITVKKFKKREQLKWSHLLIHVDVWQKTTKFYKEIIFQLENK